jgi:hypothetical protein
MHIHGNSMNVNAANLYSAGNAEKSAAAERAAAVRKRLLKAGAGVDGAESAEAASLIGHWLGETPSQPGDDAEYHASSSGKESDFG